TELEVERSTSQFGRSDDDDPQGRDDDVRLAVTADGGTLVAGTVERRRGVRDGFVATLGADRSVLEWVAYLGGAGDTHLAGIVSDSTGVPSVVGSTMAADFPSMVPVQLSAGGGLDAFVTRLAADGSALEFSTLLGGEGSDGATAVAQAPDGTLRVSGATTSRGTPFGVRDAGDAFLATVDPVASRIETLLVDRGGVEVASGLALDESGATFLAGTSREGDRARAFGAVVGASGEVHSFAVGGDDQDAAAMAVAVEPRGGAWFAG